LFTFKRPLYVKGFRIRPSFPAFCTNISMDDLWRRRTEAVRPLLHDSCDLAALVQLNLKQPMPPREPEYLLPSERCLDNSQGSSWNQPGCVIWTYEIMCPANIQEMACRVASFRRKPESSAGECQPSRIIKNAVTTQHDHQKDPDSGTRRLSSA
jgi:hypothetical protein